MINAWWQACRPKTLLISIAVIALGNGLAWSSSFSVDVLLLSLATALMLQIAVNLANDYFDGLKGIDGPERLGPQRATQAGLLAATAVRNAMLFSLMLALLSGIFLLTLSPFSVGPLWLAGASSLLAALAYSAGPWPLASNALGEVTVFIFFGLLGVCGSYYLQTGHLSLRVYLAGCQLGAIVAAVMLVNNIRDISSDAAAGKHTLAVLLGEGRARYLYAVLVLFPGLLQFFAGAPLSAALMCLMAGLLITRLWSAQGRALNALLALTSLACLAFSGLILLG